jgi:hypothetical protein
MHTARTGLKLGGGFFYTKKNKPTYQTVRIIFLKAGKKKILFEFSCQLRLAEKYFLDNAFYKFQLRINPGV